MAIERLVQVQVVHDDRDALGGMIADLVDARLIACGQILGPLNSTFSWEGSVQSADEWLALLKTRARLVDELVARLVEAHSYDLPEILVIEVAGGYAPYLEWVGERTA
jgi:periplasmic divalent cation tolerance protein